MSIRNEIAAWAAKRSGWQQSILVDLALGHTFDASDHKQLADRLLVGDGTVNEKHSLPSDWSSPEANPQVTISAIRIGENVNGLTPGECLNFASSGLTVVYGDNGSGKSGYARLLKHFCSARRDAQVLPNVFQPAPGSPPSAEIDTALNDEPQPSQSWALQPSVVSHVGFFDKDCGNDFLERDTEVAYRPSELRVLTGLSDICDGIREDLKAREDSTAAQVIQLPKVAAGGSAAQFLHSLSSETTTAEINAATKLNSDHEAKLQELLREEASLIGENPEVVRQQLLDASADLTLIADHLSEVATMVGPLALRSATAQLNDATRLRNAATAASEAQFASEPLAGVGGETWRILWEAAREFSVTEAYPAHEFPHVGDEAKCVLCQQDLEPAAKDRLSRFEAYIRDRTEQQAVAAETLAADAQTVISNFILYPAPVAGALGRVESDHRTIVGRYRRLLDAFGRARDIWLADPSADVTLPRPINALEFQLRKQSEALSKASSEIDDQGIADQLRAIGSSRQALQDRTAMNRGKQAISAEVERKRSLKAIKSAQRAVSTTGITSVVRDLTRKYVSSQIRQCFNDEAKVLNLHKVTLEDRGGQKGQLMQGPGLIKASRDAKLDSVLSEGEQTALGLAGFFTEASFDESRSAVILDDPVSSLDHGRRKQVAGKLCSLSVDRQVIVFTHDLAFVSYLRRASKDKEVEFSERSVVTTPDSRIGICRDHHPWRAQSAKKRLKELKQKLVRIKKDKGSWDEEAYGDQASIWAGRLSETLERAIGMETAGEVLDPSTLETRPQMFRLFGRITEEDNNEFQEMYSSVSAWSPRHDDSVLSNIPPLTVEQMEDLLRKAEAWLSRMSKYKSAP